MRKIVKRKQEASFINRGGTFKQVDNEGRVWEKIEFDGMPYMVTPIDTTHFNMIPKSSFVNGKIKGRPATYHVSEFRYMPEFYSDLRVWLKGGEMIGGKSFDESVKKVEEQTDFRVGDSIKVVKGRYKGIMGKVVDTSLLDSGYVEIKSHALAEYGRNTRMDIAVKNIEKITGKGYRDSTIYSLEGVNWNNVVNELESQGAVLGRDFDLIGSDNFWVAYEYDSFELQKILKENKDNKNTNNIIIEIKGETHIGDVILEKGDRIRVIENRNTYEFIIYGQLDSYDRFTDEKMSQEYQTPIGSIDLYVYDIEDGYFEGSGKLILKNGNEDYREIEETIGNFCHEMEMGLSPADIKSCSYKDIKIV